MSLSNLIFHTLGVLCVDRSEYCPDWAKDGRCKTDRWVFRNCLLSCKRFTICDQNMIKPVGKFVLCWTNTAKDKKTSQVLIVASI